MAEAQATAQHTMAQPCAHTAQLANEAAAIAPAYVDYARPGKANKRKPAADNKAEKGKERADDTEESAAAAKNPKDGEAMDEGNVVDVQGVTTA